MGTVLSKCPVGEPSYLIGHCWRYTNGGTKVMFRLWGDKYGHAFQLLAVVSLAGHPLSLRLKFVLNQS